MYVYLCTMYMYTYMYMCTMYNYKVLVRGMSSICTCTCTYIAVRRILKKKTPSRSVLLCACECVACVWCTHTHARTHTHTHSQKKHSFLHMYIIIEHILHWSTEDPSLPRYTWCSCYLLLLAPQFAPSYSTDYGCGWIHTSPPRSIRLKREHPCSTCFADILELAN